jgi:hypothetical protein
VRSEPFENFPWWMVAVCNAVGLGIYAIGLCVTACLGIVWAALYAAYCLWIEWRVLSGSCRGCYYYGRRCGFGKGRICSWFFARKSAESFCARQISWWNVLPDFLVSLVPLAVGIALLVQSFSWPILLLLGLLLLLSSAGTGFIRGQLVCKYCKQRELGCPAEQLFGKAKDAK